MVQLPPEPIAVFAAGKMRQAGFGLIGIQPSLDQAGQLFRL